MKFIKYLSAAHLNWMNIAVYQNGEKIKARAENAVTGKSIGARDFESEKHLNNWFAGLPGSGLGRLSNALSEIAVR